MRRTGLGCTIIVVACATLATPVRAAGPAPDVAALQVALRDRGVYRGTIDGVSGPATTSALMEFQRRAGLPVDGVLGPGTRHALGRYARHARGGRPLARGAFGWDVAALQFRLAWAGFPSARFSGRFGGHLDHALRAFQVFAGLTPDGVADAEVRAALRRPPPRAPFRLDWPLRAPVGDRYGPRGDRFHAGIDVPAPLGTPVRSAAPGRVTYSGWGGSGFGRLVVVDHRDGVTTIYSHLGKLRVRGGESTPAGAIVGEVGATGDATGPHLHFEVRVRGAAVDPLRALGRRPAVRSAARR
jgi:murein DD-endopeptidase MepM/ murein hydrolase activator NlpD